MDEKILDVKLNRALVNWRPPEFFSAAPQKALDRSDSILSFQLSGVPTTSFVYLAYMYPVISLHLSSWNALLE